MINGATNAITTTINANADGGIAADPQTDTIYALSAGGALEGINGKTNQVVTNTPTSTSTSNGSLAAAEELAVDPAVGTIYAIDAFNDNIGDPVTYEMEIITSCRAHVIPAAGSNCAKMAADLQPTAVSFASPADGVALGGQERSGFCGGRTGHHAGTTWAPAGRTPVAEHAGKREGAGMLSAVSPQGEFHWMVYSEPVNSELFTDYLPLPHGGRRRQDIPRRGPGEISHFTGDGAVDHGPQGPDRAFLPAAVLAGPQSGRAGVEEREAR